MAESTGDANAIRPHMNSRPKRQPAGDEEAAAQLKLGELQDARTLSLSEALLIINLVTNKRNAQKESDVLVKTKQYLEDFARVKETEHVKAMERLLSSRAELAPFERSQLGNLFPEEAERAKALIPSLEDKISDDDLQDLLQEINDSEANMV